MTRIGVCTIMPKKPIIGITPDIAENNGINSYAELPWYALRQNYADSVGNAGGIPLLIPYQYETMDDILDVINGLIIPGGDGDIPPELYGQELESADIILGGMRARFEIELTKRVLERNIPFLGICNGMQILNIALGGDLIQHIPDALDTPIDHKQPTNRGFLKGHPISVVEGSLLSSFAPKKDKITVNSNHHQAVGTLGRDLTVSATAPDGIIEAIESTKHKFVIGVEWHPEYMDDNGLDKNIFTELIKACH